MHEVRPGGKVDALFRVNVAEPLCLRTEFSLPELIPGFRLFRLFRLFRGIPGNGTKGAPPNLPSTRAGG